MNAGFPEMKSHRSRWLFYAWLLLLVNSVIGAVFFFVEVAVGFQRVAVPFVIGVGDVHQAAGLALAHQPAAGDGGTVELRGVFVVAAFQFLPVEYWRAVAEDEVFDCVDGHEESLFGLRVFFEVDEEDG